jgi:hypothetical protein
MDKKESKLVRMAMSAAASGLVCIVVLELINRNPSISVQRPLMFLPGIFYGLTFVLLSILPIGRPLLHSRFQGLAKVPMSLVFIGLTTGAYYAACWTVLYLINPVFSQTQGAVLAFCGLLGGGVGALLFALSIAMFFPSMASRRGVTKVFLMGMVGGLLLYSAGSFRIHGVYFFIMAWQVLVALVLALEDISAEQSPRRHRPRRSRQS